MDINDRQFNLSLVGKVFKHLDDKFVVMFSYLGDLKKQLYYLINNKINIETTAKVDFSGVIKSLSLLEKQIQLVANQIKEGNTNQSTSDEQKSEGNKIVSSLEVIRKQISLIVIPKPEKAEKVIFPAQFSLKESKQIIGEIANLQDILLTLVDIVKKLKFKDSSEEVVEQLKDLQKSIVGLSKPSKTADKAINIDSLLDKLVAVEKAIKEIKIPEVVIPETVEVSNWPPQKVPQPVTNINLNPLRGIVHPTTTTVSSSLTTLPSYGVLENRRAIIFYNNSSTITVFIGGSTVTTSNGLPIDPKSFSPSFDSGPRQVWYGVTTSGTADVRTVEIANDTGA